MEQKKDRLLKGQSEKSYRKGKYYFQVLPHNACPILIRQNTMLIKIEQLKVT
jgi:hypothetical protein